MSDFVFREESMDEFEMWQGGGGAVKSVNGMIGDVVLTAEDVGALPDTYEAPVTSVNTQTGDVVLDAGDIAYESTTVEEELGTINSALTSLSSVTEIIDTASGAIASFPDGSGLPIRSLVAEINPVQDLHGYDNPWPAGGGKNQFICYNDTKTTAGLTFELRDHYVFITGTCTVDTSLNLNFGGSTTVGATLENGSAYTWSAKTEGTIPDTMYIYGGYIGTSIRQTSQFTSSGSQTLTIPADGSYKDRVWIGVHAGEVYNGTLYIQTEKGSTKTAYAPYSNICPVSGHTGLSGWVEDEYDPTEQPTFSVNWQDEAGTVYGGQDDVVGGELTSTMGIITLDGTQSISIVNWRASSTSVGWVYPYSLTNNKVELADSNMPNVVCDSLPTITYANAFSMSKDVGITTLASSTGASSYGLVVRINDPTLTTASAINAYLSAHPITVVYELATPQTFTHAPTQISTLYGQNNVWHDANGDTTVTYQANLKGYIDKKLA